MYASTVDELLYGNQQSTPNSHQQVGPAENAFLHDVPGACALLRGSQRGENHMFTAFVAYQDACNQWVTASGKSPSEQFFGDKRESSYPQEVYGTACTYLIHPEIRPSKYDDHAQPGWYAGKSRVNQSPSSCWVFNGTRYVTADLVNVKIDEIPTVAFTFRSNQTLQPFAVKGNVVVAEPIANPNPTDQSSAV